MNPGVWQEEQTLRSLVPMTDRLKSIVVIWTNYVLPRRRNCRISVRLFRVSEWKLQWQKDESKVFPQWLVIWKKRKLKRRERLLHSKNRLMAKWGTVR